MIKDILEENQEPQNLYKLNFTPLFIVNNALFRGNFQNDIHIVKVLCQTLNNKAPSCQKIGLNPEFEAYAQSDLSTYVFGLLKGLVLLAVVSIIGFYVYYKMKTRGKMEKEIEKRVNSAILKYYGNSEFGDVNGGSGARKRKPSDENV